jgi:hypothetical protein|tara:strand:- start:2858 stop:3529 length:672 start_codon:yes stop_codon:yes gene_type:complete
MTLKEIGKHYRVFKRNGQYHLSTLEVQTTGRDVYKYICTITKNDRFFRLGNKIPTAKIGVLLEQIQEYLNEIEYDSAYYNPNYREGAAQDLFVYDKLNEYGYKRNYMNDFFSPTRDSIYGLSVSSVKIWYNVNEENRTVEINLTGTDDSWITTKASFDFKDIHKTIDSLLKPLLLTEGIKDIEQSEKMVMSEVELSIRNLKGLNINTSKLELKEKLIEMANAL